MKTKDELLENFSDSVSDLVSKFKEKAKERPKVELPKKEKVSKVNAVLKRTICFWSPFSDGSTSCSIQFAKALKRQFNVRIALVELDMLHPSFDKYYKSEAGGLLEILRTDKQDRVTFETIQDAACQDDQGFDIYKAYFNYIDLYHLNIDRVERVMTMISGMYDFVIFDTNRSFENKLTHLALEKSDQIIIPISANLMDINLLNQYLDLFEDNQDWSVLKCCALINKYMPNDPVFAEIENNLKCEVIGYLKHDVNFSKSKSITREFNQIVKKEVRR